MRHVLQPLAAALLALGIASPSFAAASVAGPARPLHPAPSPTAAEVAETRSEFLADALRSLGDRAGDLFFLPRKYNFVSGVDLAPGQGQTGHVRLDGRVVTFTGPGISHGAPWSYDRDIPLVVWGPGFIESGKRVLRRTQQQDLVPTYARLIGAPLPTDARGSVLAEALKPGVTRKPKLIFTMVFDQAGEAMYRLHPGATPFIDRLKREGTNFANTRVSHLDLETAMGHVAIGTGAFPMDHGIPSNTVWHGGHGGDFNEFTGFEPSAPFYMMSPTLGDFWLRATHERGHVFSYCWVDRAAMGMGGHGTFFKGVSHKPYIFWLDQAKGLPGTNEAFYQVPPYVAQSSPHAYAGRFTGPNGTWLDHPLGDIRELIASPAMPAWEGDMLAEVFKREPYGTGDTPDLVYTTLKSTDMAGHYYGQESLEVEQVLHEQDRQFERLFNQLVAKVGRENLVVVLTADHGGPPLPELSGGQRLFKRRFLAELNQHFQTRNDGVPLAEFMSDTQLWLDRVRMAENGVTPAEVKAYLLNYRLNGVRWFDQAYTREELVRIRSVAGPFR